MASGQHLGLPAADRALVCVAADLVGQCSLRRALDPEAVAVAVVIETAIDPELSFREAERALPGLGRFRHGHPEPKLSVEREQTFVRKVALRLRAKQEMIPAKGAIEQPPGLPCRAVVFRFASQAKQPARGRVDRHCARSTSR